MAEKKEAAWREDMAYPDSLHRRYKQTVSIPTYLRRWLVVYGNKEPDALAAELLEQAMMIYVRSFHAADSRQPSQYDPISSLVAGVYVDGNESALCQSFEETHIDFGPKGKIVCVTNGIYGYFFNLYDTDFSIGNERPSRPGRFLDWVMREFSTGSWFRAKDIEGPVIRLKRGNWPLQPRLIPGHRDASRQLEYKPDYAWHRPSQATPDDPFGDGIPF